MQKFKSQSKQLGPYPVVQLTIVEDPSIKYPGKAVKQLNEEHDEHPVGHGEHPGIIATIYRKYPGSQTVH